MQLNKTIDNIVILQPETISFGFTFLVQKRCW